MGVGPRSHSTESVLARRAEDEQTEGQTESPGVLAAAKSEEEGAQLAQQGFQPVLNSFHVFSSLSQVHGWGVFAAKDFVEGEVMHESPGRLINGTADEIRDDIFEIGWDEENAEDLSLLGFGFASLHNHADEPNTGCIWEKSPRHGGAIVGTFYALRPIGSGEELFISYGDQWWEDREFTKSDAPSKMR